MNWYSVLLSGREVLGMFGLLAASFASVSARSLKRSLWSFVCALTLCSVGCTFQLFKCSCIARRLV